MLGIERNSDLIEISPSSKRNGGNIVLKKLSLSLKKKLGVVVINEILFKESVPKLFSVIFFIIKIFLLRFRKERAYIVSDPVLVILLSIIRLKNVIHFVQSDDINLYSNLDFPSYLTRFFRGLYIFFVPKMNWVTLYNSAYSYNKLEHLFINRTKSYVIPTLGIPGLIKRQGIKFKKSKDTKNENINIIWIGTLHVRKGFSDLKKVYTLLPSVKITAVFSGNVPDNIPSPIRVLSNITSEEVNIELKKSDYLISTTRFESLGLPVIEALALGVTVLALNNEAYETNGITDFMYTYSDIEALCEDLSKNNLISKQGFDQLLDSQNTQFDRFLEGI